MLVAWPDVLSLIRDHPLIAAWFALLFFLIIALGVMHVSRIFGSLLVEVIREFKRELLGIRKTIAKLRHELTTWKIDE